MSLAWSEGFAVSSTHTVRLMCVGVDSCSDVHLDRLTRSVTLHAAALL